MDQDLYLKTTPEQLKVRCPGCLKLYSVNAAEIFESKPKFSCVSCQQKFWFPFPEAMEEKQGIMGFPLEWIQDSEPAPEVPATTTQVAAEPELSKIEAKPFSCPACGVGYAGGQKECSSCGIVFEKFETRRREPELPDSSPELKEFWDLALNEYEKAERHDAFIGQALGEGSLAYAQYRYSQVLSMNPADAMALQSMKKIEALSLARVEAKIPVREVRGFQMKMPKLRIGTMMLFLCGVVIALGLFIPGARNLVGMGSAFLFLLLALRYYFRII